MRNSYPNHFKIDTSISGYLTKVEEDDKTNSGLKYCEECQVVYQVEKRYERIRKANKISNTYTIIIMHSYPVVPSLGKERVDCPSCILKKWK